MLETLKYCDQSRHEALDGSAITDAQKRHAHELMKPYLVVMPFRHWGYSRRQPFLQGQLVVHEGMLPLFKAIECQLIDLRYPIKHARPMTEYGWSDAKAMADNNTSVYRPDIILSSGAASEHTRGTAIDLNPLDNPLQNYDGSIEPTESIGRERWSPAVIDARQDVIDMFDQHNMEWGGYWPIRGARDFYTEQTPLDRHHFELRPSRIGSIAVPEGLWNS